MQLHLTRHGQVERDPACRIGEPNLSELGCIQATRLGRRLAAEGFRGTVYASPYLRTVWTAHLIAEQTDSQVILAPPIREVVVKEENIRRYRGYTVEELQARFPRVAIESDWTWPWWTLQIEDPAAIDTRVGPFVDHLVARGTDVLLVGHGASVGGVLRHVIRRSERKPTGDIPPAFNCALSSFRLSPEFSLGPGFRLNCTDHLDEDQVTANQHSKADVLAARARE